jgi:hypothetical protein
VTQHTNPQKRGWLHTYRARIHNRITLYKSVSQKNMCVWSRSSLRCLVTASNGGRTFAHVSASWRISHANLPLFCLPSQDCLAKAADPCCIASARTVEKTPLHYYVLSCCLGNNASTELLNCGQFTKPLFSNESKCRGIAVP